MWDAVIFLYYINVIEAIVSFFKINLYKLCTTLFPYILSQATEYASAQISSTPTLQVAWF